ncbi:MAG TPA: hypothetical protein VKV26_05115 [Dehalococcoidia bacterium]|nr:hypothetical protein [Dehalococcoidia bacterium]
MPASRQPFDPSRPNLSETAAGSPTLPAAADSAEVEGYILIFCHFCTHSHEQTDPKCNSMCLHGTTGFSSGPTGGITSPY